MINLDNVFKKAKENLSKVKTREELEKFRIEYFGRKKGIFTEFTKNIPKLSIDDKKNVVPLFNRIKTELKNDLEEKSKTLISEVSTIKAKNRNELDQKHLPFDPSGPSKKLGVGHNHPLSLVIDEVKNIFQYLGFSWVDGPEIEREDYNFTKLLISEDHPSRDVQQTYYITDDLLLRTHTSPMQIRYMEKHKPPLRIISPGRVYRRDMPDATHLPDFFQIEGLLIDESSKLTDLLGSLDFFLKRFFGPKTKVRFYGHNFPYTEPSIEVEVLHPKKGWIEILGSGMVHPDVLRNVGINPEKYSGWAFGMGPDRLAMLKYEIDDIRLLYSGDIKFLEQF